MKAGFSKKKAKVKKNKKGAKAQDGDDAMVDAGPAAPPAPSPEPQMADAPVSAKDKQRHRMELKKALKVQVANLKSKRNKLTKLQQTERRQLNTELKGLVQEQLSTKQAKGSTGKQQQQPEAQAAAAAAAPVDMMAE